MADLGHDVGQDILWIDYSAAISLHRGITGKPGDHRHQRIVYILPETKPIQDVFSLSGNAARQNR